MVVVRRKRCQGNAPSFGVGRRLVKSDRAEMAERRSIARTAGPEPRRSFGGRVRVSTLEVQDFRSEVRLFDERLEVSLGNCVVCRAAFTGTSDATLDQGVRDR